MAKESAGGRSSLGEGSDEPLRSALSGNTDMAELIGWFVEELGRRCQTLRTAWGEGDIDTIRTIAHQLRGSSAGYGFERVGLAAGELELSIVRSGTECDELDGVRANLEALLELCSRVAA